MITKYRNRLGTFTALLLPMAAVEMPRKKTLDHIDSSGTISAIACNFDNALLLLSATLKFTAHTGDIAMSIDSRLMVSRYVEARGAI